MFSLLLVYFPLNYKFHANKFYKFTLNNFFFLYILGTYWYHFFAIFNVKFVKYTKILSTF